MTSQTDSFNPFNDYLNQFQQRLEKQLLTMLHASEQLPAVMPQSDDIDDRWLTLAQGYLPDAVPEVASYPTVSLGWATFLGMAVAHEWDNDWARCRNKAYTDYYGTQGFDNMDEHIVANILGLELDSTEAATLVGAVQRAAESAVSAIRGEHVEPQTSAAFHLFARACTVMFRIGAALELYRLGYNMERVGE